VLTGCRSHSWKVEPLDSPAGPGSGMPFLRAAGDDVWMSWLEQSSGKAALQCAVWNGSWSQPRTIVSNDQLFVNWADFPSILPLRNGAIAAHWLQKRGEDKYAYDLMSAVSRDQGLTWGIPLRVHTDESENEHGFASLTELPGTDFAITWLDARNYKQAKAMSLMHASFRDGSFEKEITIDPRVCDCCQTDVARIPDGLFVLYRDRSEEEIRDISYVRLVDGKWTSPKTIHSDRWKIDGCPVNGPAVSSAGDRVAVAWYTGANDQPRVYAAFSNNRGDSFSAPVRVDSGNPSGRVDIELLDNGSAVVSWMENQKEKGADIRIRNVFQDGSVVPPMIVADTTNARSSGVPRMTRAGNNLFIAWTFTSDPPRIRVARVLVPSAR
jgi:hypothetical protein